jgi:uncharacterized membrane protein YphA (DoxX/SURF4 family)
VCCRLSLKGGITLSRSSCHLGVLGAVTLIALRLVIGFHFLSEGIDKLLDPKPFSSSFFESAKGPMASFYRGHMWDPDGLLRLGYKPSETNDRTHFQVPSIDLSATKANWRSYRQRIASHYGFNEQQEKASENVVKKYERLLDTFANENGGDIIEYFQGIQRREQNKRDTAHREVASLRGQATTTEMELRGKRAALLAKVDALWAGIERELNEIAGNSKQTRLAIRKIGRSALDTESLDTIVPWFDLAIGACLIVGLLTRFAGVLGALFLAMVVSSQWPGMPGALPTWPQAIECLALLHLAAIGAGQYGGVDGILRVTLGRCCRRKQGT